MYYPKNDTVGHLDDIDHIHTGIDLHSLPQTQNKKYSSLLWDLNCTIIKPYLFYN